MRMIKGTLDVLILRTLSGAPLHGYAISRFVREASEAALNLEEGALYPALRRLEKKGLVVSRLDNAAGTGGARKRRVVSITHAGIDTLSESRKALVTLWDGVEERLDATK